MTNYYQILGISPDTDSSKIKAAAQAKANEINEAFRVLNDPDKRNAYDMTLVAKPADVVRPEPVSEPEITYSTTSTTTPPQFKVSGESRQRFTNMLSSWSEHLHIETPSFRDVAILSVALVFFFYMLGQFFFPPPITPPAQPALSLGTYSSSSKN